MKLTNKTPNLPLCTAVPYSTCTICTGLQIWMHSCELKSQRFKQQCWHYFLGSSLWDITNKCRIKTASGVINYYICLCNMSLFDLSCQLGDLMWFVFTLLWILKWIFYSTYIVKLIFCQKKRERAMKEGSKFHVLILGLELLYDSTWKKNQLLPQSCWSYLAQL